MLLVLVSGPGAEPGVVLAMSALLIWRHRSNITKLRSGTEAKIGARSGPEGGA